MSGVRYSPGLGEMFCVVVVGGARGADLDGMGGRKVGGSCEYGEGYAFSGGSGVGRYGTLLWLYGSVSL